MQVSYRSNDKIMHYLMDSMRMKPMSSGEDRKLQPQYFLTFSDQQRHYQHAMIKTPGPAFPHRTAPAPNTNTFKIREEILQHSTASDPGDNSQLSLVSH